MTLGGWIIMCAAVGGMTLLFGWCIWKVLSTPGSGEHLHGFEVETPDRED